jgi:hypothetical protein
MYKFNKETIDFEMTCIYFKTPSHNRVVAIKLEI